MKAPLSWLKQYVDIDLPPEELAHMLTMAGTEVGAIDAVGGWDNVVVAEVVGIEPHPQADRLKLVTVDTAGSRTTVVCGAPNVAVGQRVPFARLGAELINPQSGRPERLKKAKIRGVTSEGMVCSECELGISDSHTGIMVLPDDAPKGAPLDDYLGDVIFDMSITPNRPDLLSITGIAREIAALTGKTMRLPDTGYSETQEAAADKASVEILDPDLCPRYCASIITNVQIKPSPPWMQQRLLACGMRPISNIVDVTNYVMLEYGQPLHAFDYDNIADRRIIVRRAKDEKMNTLDGVARALSNDMLVIADGMGPVAVAGVMGGAESEVTDATTTILLESANFNPASIRRTSSTFKLRSEASLRFEKGLSPELPLPALKRATQLIAELSGGRIAKGIIDVYPGKCEAKPIKLTASKVERVLGVEVPVDKVVETLGLLEFRCERSGKDELAVNVPYWRTDVRLAEDLVEEVARIIGYDEIPTTIPSGALPAYKPQPARDLREKVIDILVGCGMQEVITYSLISRAALDKVPTGITPLKVANPITTQQEYLRTSLRYGLLRALSDNEKHEEGGIKLFEAGKIYIPRDNDLPEERYMIAGVLAGPRLDCFWQGKNEQMDLFDAKGILETLLKHIGVEPEFEPVNDSLLTPGRTVGVKAGGELLGVLGELHPRAAERFDIDTLPAYLFEIDLQKLIAVTGKAYKYQPVPRFPATLRDMALVVDMKTTSKDIQDIIEKSPLVVEAMPFDVYTGEQVPRGKKSLAFRITYQSPERTLTDEEVDRAHQQILDRLSKELGATLR